MLWIRKRYLLLLLTGSRLIEKWSCDTQVISVIEITGAFYIVQAIYSCSGCRKPNDMYVTRSDKEASVLKHW